MVDRLSVLGSLAALVVVLAAPAEGQNLVPNSGFDTDLSDWQVFSGAAWDAEDAGGDPGSGSVRITNSSPNPNVITISASVCLPVAPDRDYRFGFDGLVPAQPTTGAAVMSIAWNRGVGCPSGEVIFSQDLRVDDVGSWRHVDTFVTSPADAQSVTLRLGSFREGATGDHAVKLDNILFEAVGGGCAPDDETLCLVDGRFAVRTAWRTDTGATGVGHAVPLSPADGRFWFFAETNTELIVKVIDACGAPFDRFWVFAGGLTNVEVEITVTDTENPSEVRTYRNPLGTPFQPIQDTNAFATCP